MNDDNDWVPHDIDNTSTMMGGLTVDGRYLDPDAMVAGPPRRNALHHSDDPAVVRLGDLVASSPNEVACMGGLLIGIMLGLDHPEVAQNTIAAIKRKTGGSLGPLEETIDTIVNGEDPEPW